jgi:hypothetical protein
MSVCRGWPAETDISVPSSGRMKLREQGQVIRDAITASFPFLHASIVTVHAFPNALLMMTFITRALVQGISYSPNATHIRSRMLNDHVYLARIAQLVCYAYEYSRKPLTYESSHEPVSAFFERRSRNAVLLQSHFWSTFTTHRRSLLNSSRNSSRTTIIISSRDALRM